MKGAADYDIRPVSGQSEVWGGAPNKKKRGRQWTRRLRATSVNFEKIKGELTRDKGADEENAEIVNLRGSADNMLCTGEVEKGWQSFRTDKKNNKKRRGAWLRRASGNFAG